MSTNVRKVGYSVKLTDVPVEKLKEICKALNQDYDEYSEDEFYPNFDDEKHLNQWIITNDFNGNYGFVKIIDYEYDSFDLVSSISMIDMVNVFTELSDIWEELGIELTPNNLKEEDFKTFSLLYYNGSDEPFTF